MDTFDYGRRGRGGRNGEHQAHPGGGDRPYAQAGGHHSRPGRRPPRVSHRGDDDNRGWYGDRPFEDRFNYQPDFKRMQMEQQWNDWQEERPVRSPETVEWAASRPDQGAGRDERQEWFSSQPEVAEGQKAAIRQWIQQNPLAAQWAQRMNAGPRRG